MALLEGETFLFNVLALKRIDPDSEQSFFVLEGPNGGKFLLPSHPYSAYGIKVGGKIACKIDKISCSGKIYLEPENPFYKVGNTYSFEVVKVETCSLQNGEKAEVAIVLDKFGDTTGVNISKSIRSPKTITCLVIGIKKGQLYLEFGEDAADGANLEAGKWYDFQISGEYLHSDGKKNLILVSVSNGSRHFILANDYEHYGLMVGQTISALVTRKGRNGYYYLEPKHPQYIIGNKYFFEIVDVTQFTRQEDNAEIVLVTVIDWLQKKASFLWSDENLPLVGEKIQCQVIGLRKGKLILSQ
ncbi:MAG TPA: hypothetical protein VMV56_10085 [Williamwhitmania sp.]|nr:hypothetical protein [Williamwhitmania sp.]